ncbi:hypothetical protein O7606_18610 [Micromonospora sp. WMMD882]|uniref:DUF6924 domain-containing protein n=1 Tax=Micromonospora sp. WMMD882 TaxID=3015151 RepID=UPI00248BC8A1|nr:hypothetical protein [Micromonospora sp. WMMD882]WBB78240.1 hypothetical protein O7606_18610 [Micromonospora sp. WMMD882]
MTPLPLPLDLTSLVLRTDFADESAWQGVKDDFRRWGCYYSATYVEDPAYRDAAVERLIEANATEGDPGWLRHLFVTDTTTITDPERPLLAVDLSREPGRTFRVPPRWYASVSDNLTLGNMDFADFASSVDPSGVFRGFEQT